MLQDDRRELVGEVFLWQLPPRELPILCSCLRIPVRRAHPGTVHSALSDHLIPGLGKCHVVTEDDLCFGYCTWSLNCAEQSLGTIWMNGSFASDFNGSMVSPWHLSCISYISIDVTGWKPRPALCHFSQGRNADISIWGAARHRCDTFIFGLTATRFGGCGAFISMVKIIPPLIKIVILVQRHLGSRHICHVTVAGMCCLIHRCTLTFISLMLTKCSEWNKSTILYYDHMDWKIIFIAQNIIFIP